MPQTSTYAALNQLLIDLGRSLLQYVGECWPWTDPETTAEQQKINELVQLQKHQIAQLTRLLTEADWPVHRGAYPTEYTDLHYVALSYLLHQLVINERALMEEAKRTLPLCEGHPEAKKLVGEIQSLQQTIAHELETLAQKTPPSPSKSV
jgi:hypothetical protein